MKRSPTLFMVLLPRFDYTERLIEHTKAGLWLTQPMGEKARTNGLYMAGLRIRNLMADGINFAVGTGNSMMEQSDIRYQGMMESQCGRLLTAS